MAAVETKGMALLSPLNYSQDSDIVVSAVARTYTFSSRPCTERFRAEKRR